MTAEATTSADRELAERLCSELREGHVDNAVSLLHPNFHASLAAGLPLGLGATYEGPDSMRAGVYDRVGEHFDLGPEVDEILSVEPGRVVVVGRYVGSARVTGHPIEAAFVWLLRTSDGQVSELVQVTDTALWSRALGYPDSGDSHFEDEPTSR